MNHLLESWTRFFRGQAPRTRSEGALQGFLAGGILMCLYDIMDEPKTPAEIKPHSTNVLIGYFTFIVMGALMGHLDVAGERELMQHRL